jgi:hypothetical protein
MAVRGIDEDFPAYVGARNTRSEARAIERGERGARETDRRSIESRGGGEGRGRSGEDAR